MPTGVSYFMVFVNDGSDSHDPEKRVVLQFGNNGLGEFIAMLEKFQQIDQGSQLDVSEIVLNVNSGLRLHLVKREGHFYAR